MEEKDILLSPQMLEKIAKQLGYSGSIPPQFVELATSLLMGGMAKNTNSDEATDAIIRDIEADDEGRTILSQLDTDGEEPDLRKTEGKEGLLDNLLGNKLDPLAQAFSEATGLPKEKSKKLMMILAPILLAMIAQRVNASNGGERQGVKDVIKKTYKNPPRSREEFQLEQQRLQLEQQKNELELQKRRIEERQRELEKRQEEFQKRKVAIRSKNQGRKKNRYQIPNKQDEGLLEQLLDKDGDGNFVEEAVGLLRKLLLK